MAEALTANPLFGITLTLTAFAAGQLLYKRLKLSILHPVLTSSAAIIALLLILNIRLDNYQEGAAAVSFLLGPATVSLAVPLYRQISILKKNAAVILVSVFAGAAASMVSVILISKAIGLPEELVLSLVPKSVTTPIAVEASEELGGLPSITAISVIITGITGAVLGPYFLRLLRIKSPLAGGLAMGTSSHAIGTARALELGETEGAMSSLAIGLAGIITVLTAPVLVSLLI
jgi:predicted murein hydrolase (TIGR00659 family)